MVNALAYNNWPHPADCPIITVSEDNKDTAIQAYTDECNGEQVVGSVAAIFIGNKMVTQIKFKLHNCCSSNQAEELAIIKALEAIDTISSEQSSPCTTTV